MRPRTAAIVSAGLGLLVVAPVLALVALGAYGGAIEAAEARSSGQPELVVSPPHGTPGTAVTASGRSWPPRSLVSLYFSHSAPGVEPQVRVRLGQVVASRSGAFEVDTVIPSAAVPPGAASVFLEAESLSPEAGVIRSGPARFAVDAYPTSLDVRIADAATGAGVPDSQVELSDAFGRTVQTGTTDADGRVTFRNVVPGEVRVQARHLDYAPARDRISLGPRESAAIEMVAPAASRSRLYAPAAIPGPEDADAWVGVDRVSGLAFSEPVPGKSAALRRRLDPKRALTHDYLIPISEESEGGYKVRAAFESLRVVDGLLSGVVPQYPTSVRFSGIGAGGVLAFFSYGEYTCAGCTGLFLLDIDSATLRRRLTLPPEVLPPILSRDGMKAYLLNWKSRNVEIRSLPEGTVAGKLRGLPPLLIRAVLEPSGESLLLLSALRGAVYRLDLTTGALSGPILEAAGSVALGALNDGRILLLRPSFDDLVVANADGSALRFVPLEGRDSWLWVDPRGAFIYTGRVLGPQETQVTLWDATLGVAGRVELPYAAYGVGGS